MNDALLEKIKTLCNKITIEAQEVLKIKQLDCQSNLDNSIANYKIKKKYIYIDIATSGRYIVEINSGTIYGIKAYGVINKAHYYGTLDTISSYFWGGFKAYKIQSRGKNEIS